MTQRKPFSLWLTLGVALAALLAATGCREAGNNVSAGFGSLSAPGASANRGLGLLLYNVYHTSLRNEGDTAAMTTLEGHRPEFIDAINAIIPAEVSQNLFGTIQDLLPLIDDGTIPGMAEDVRLILESLRQNDAVLQAIVNMQDATSVANAEDYVTLVSRLLAYPQFDPLLEGIGQVMGENDGVDANGQANGERDLVTELLGVLSRQLKNLPDAQAGSAGASKLVDVLLTVVEPRDGVDLGDPSWCVSVDADGHPLVRKGTNGDFLPPFVDKNHDDAIDKVNGEPVDTNGTAIEIAAFGVGGNRDADGRALTSQGELLYEYFDGKKTVLASVLRLVGDVLRDKLQTDLLALVDGIADRSQQGGYSDDNPLIDLQYASLELFKGQPTHSTLRGMAALLNSDPDFAESILADLGKMVEIVRNTPIAPTSSSGSQLDTLVPLLDEAFEHNGHSESAIRALLSAFSTEQQTLGNLPEGFALMMKYHNYGTQTLTGPGKPSSMQSLLEMVYEADQCNNPLGGGTLAELYIDSIAGNAKILGISINIQTMNLITQLLGTLICNGLTQQHIAALKDFDTTGTLAAFTPIATVFSDRGETRLLVDIMSALHEGYASSMAPMEPAIIDILESGAVHKFFDAFDKMNSVAVPGSNDVVSDAVADALAVLVDDDASLVDRHGQPVDSLLHLLLGATEDLLDRVDQRGLDDEAEKLLDFGLAVLTSTVQSGQGLVLTNGWLIPLAAAALDDLAESLPTDQAARAAEVERMQADVEEVLTHADLTVAVDVLLAIDASTAGDEIYAALVHLFTPSTTTADDVFGSLVPLLCSVLNTQSSADPQDMVEVLRFLGQVIDPSANMINRLVDGVQALLEQDEAQTVLGIVRNAFDKGPNGTDEAPIQVLLDIMDDVSGNSSLPTAGPLTVGSLKDSLTEIIDFIQDDVAGLPFIFNQLSQRAF